MAAALVRVDVFDLPDADRKGGAVVRALRERRSGRTREQRAGKRAAAAMFHGVRMHVLLARGNHDCIETPLIPAHSASLRAFTPVFDGLWTRVNALMAGRPEVRPPRAP